jgi:hypothetical protein
MRPIQKYPRTQHLLGSRLQPGDEDLDAVPMAELEGQHVVLEEKMDGANSGISFDTDGTLLLQSRGHYLLGGPREKQFNLLKQWAATVQDQLFDALADRYILYGEWLYAKHTVYYDALPHFFLEFDIRDTTNDTFLDTPRRAELLKSVQYVPVKVLYRGPFPGEERLRELIGPSYFRTSQALDSLKADTEKLGWDVELTLRQTDLSDRMEGLYVKTEADGVVTGRYKFVRRDFIQKVTSEGHWQDRPLIPNRLAEGVSLFGEV